MINKQKKKNIQYLFWRYPVYLFNDPVDLRFLLSIKKFNMNKLNN